ncbi:uncharacterized protein LOC127094952 [Lathyrus oleraceus]|uniref:uncharacterized protein LOC127094952 n=1 Tax=Pisum sativum TaxID=3888 RepID=UPI0021CF516C|nr:uncharacterized protein LOC127094952 [Pisum sativum]
MYNYDTDNELHNRMRENPQRHQNVVHKLQKMLRQFNPFVIRFKQLSLLPNISECSLILKERPNSMEYGRDISVIRHDGNLKKVQETKGYYDPLQYHIFYMLQIRPNDQSKLLNAGRLLQQYVVDNYIKIESWRLKWIKEHQSDISDELYQGRDRSVDNRWVVPYNPWLLLKYDYHINVEICSSIKSNKYLYKYVYKGPDRVAMEVHKGSYMDEVQQYVDARWICAPEALWKIFRFTLYRLYFLVKRLQIHLLNRHQVRFYDHQRITDVLNT